MRFKSKFVAQYPETDLKTVKVFGGSRNYGDFVVGFKESQKGLESGCGWENVGVYAQLFDAKKGYISPVTGALFVESGQVISLKETPQDDFIPLIINGDNPVFYFDVRTAAEGCITMVYAGKDRVRYLGNSFKTEKDATVGFYTGVMHNGRLFARDLTDGFKIRWSGRDFDDFSSGIGASGYVILSPEGGRVIAMFSFGDKLIAVRERGITEIRALGDPQHFKVDQTASFMTADGIIADTCAVCGGELLFCTQSGIFAYDGNAVKRLNLSIGADICACKCAAACGDKYFVVCNSAKLGEGKLYVYSAGEGDGYYAEIPAVCAVGGSELYVFNGQGTYRMKPDGGRGEWRSKAVDFGNAGVKLLKEVVLDCEGNITLGIEGGGVSRTFKGRGRKSVKLAGRSFTFKLYGSGKIFSLEAVAEVKDGV